MASNDDTRYDVVVVGGGPAGLAAALWLARYRRRVRVYDADEPRNRPAWAVHGYPGLPELSPAELRRRVREQATGAGAEVVSVPVESVRGARDAFDVHPADPSPPLRARRVLLAFGRRDILPDIPGVDESYGRLLFHCPDCDGPSMADARVGVIGWGRGAADTAVYLRTWTNRIVLLAHGHPLELDDRARAVLDECGIPIHTARIRRLFPRRGHLSHLLLDDGTRVRLDGIFCHLGSRPGSDLARRLGCATDRAGHLRTDTARQTTVPGVYAAGDITGHPHLAISAASGGVRAALALHRSLLPERHRL